MNKNTILKAIVAIFLIVSPFVFILIEPVRTVLAFLFLYSCIILVIIAFIAAVWATIEVLFDKNLSCHLGIGLFMVVLTLMLGILLIELLFFIFSGQPIIF